MEAGVVALYQKCVHLGCRVPWCTSSQWFECPCHGSQVQPGRREDRRPRAARPRPLRRHHRRRQRRRRHRQGDPGPAHRHQHHRPGAGRAPLRMRSCSFLGATTQQTPRCRVRHHRSSLAGRRSSLVHVRRSGESAGRRDRAPRPTAVPTSTTRRSKGQRLEQRPDLGARHCCSSSCSACPLYWLDEPSRQAGAIVGFDKRAADRGFVLFQPADSTIPEGNIGHFGCGGCHGSVGQGGVTSVRHHRRSRPQPSGELDGAGAQRRAAALQRGRGRHDHHLRPGQHADAAVGRRGRRPDEHPAGRTT